MTCLGAQAVREEGNKALYCPAGLAVALGLSSFYWPLSRVPSQQSHFPKFSKKVVPVSRDLLPLLWYSLGHTTAQGLLPSAEEELSSGLAVAVCESCDPKTKLKPSVLGSGAS